MLENKEWKSKDRDIIFQKRNSTYMNKLTPNTTLLSLSIYA